MATLEQRRLATQVQTTLGNMRIGMRSAAQSYLNKIVAGDSIASIVVLAVGQTNNYILFLNGLLAAHNNLAVRAKITAGLTAEGVLYADMISDYTELRAAANAEQVAEQAGITTAAQLQAMANATLANVAGWDTTFPSFLNG